MTDFKNSIACSGSILWAAILGALGGPHVLLTSLLWLIVIDYASGVIAAQYKGVPFNWDKAMKGIWKKLLYFIVILFAVQVDRALSCPEVGLITSGKVRIAFLILLNGSEASSILRHFGACDITVPVWIKQMVLNMKSGKTGGGDSK